MSARIVERVVSQRVLYRAFTGAEFDDVDTAYQSTAEWVVLCVYATCNRQCDIAACEPLVRVVAHALRDMDQGTSS